jgi:aminoglycoside phosphotransferase (APT) family kinase protein
LAEAGSLPGDFEERLAAFVRTQRPDAAEVRITGLRRVGTGLSRENWPFDLSWRQDGRSFERRLILRRDPAGSVLETDRQLEYDVLRALEGSAIPAPRALWVDAAGEWLDRPFIVMERYEGVCDYFVLNGGELGFAQDHRERLARRFCELLATIHGFDWRAAGLDRILPDPGANAAEAAIDEWQSTLERQLLEPMPEMTEVLCWLRRNAPRAQATVLVHGDFKPGNALIKNGEVEVILDWETMHLGDPMEDIGWVTNPVRQAEHLIPGAWEREQLYSAYEELTGFRVREEDVRFWNVFANFKLTTILLTGIRSLCEGRADRVYSYSSAQGMMSRLLASIGV